MRDIAELDFNKVATGDTKPNAWTLLDFGRFYSPFSFYRSIYAAILFLNHHPTCGTQLDQSPIFSVIIGFCIVSDA